MKGRSKSKVWTHTDEHATSTDEHTAFNFLLFVVGAFAVDAWISFCILAFCMGYISVSFAFILV